MLLELLRKRRSVRQFQDRPVEKEKIEALLEGALRSPSSRGFNPWEFIVVEERETLVKMAQSKPHGAAFLKNTPLAIVVCADQRKTDVWVEDTSIASLILHLLAADLGLGSCWVQIRLRDHDEHTTAQEYLTELLELEEDIVVEAIIGIGYEKGELSGHSHSSLLYDRIHREKFGRKI
jgi:nitroreductase